LRWWRELEEGKESLEYWFGQIDKQLNTSFLNQTVADNCGLEQFSANQQKLDSKLIEQ
jgi:hypothetical protein